jgi:hypothetical protein
VVKFNKIKKGINKCWIKKKESERNYTTGEHIRIAYI